MKARQISESGGSMAADAARIRETAKKLAIAMGVGHDACGSDSGISRAACDGCYVENLLAEELVRFAAAVERGGWVAVAERLPEIREPYKDGPKCSARVLATEGRRVYICTYGETFEKRIPRWTEGGTFGRGLATVTHWRELPSPPEAAPQVSQLAKEEQQK